MAGSWRDRCVFRPRAAGRREECPPTASAGRHGAARERDCKAKRPRVSLARRSQRPRLVPFRVDPPARAASLFPGSPTGRRLPPSEPSPSSTAWSPATCRRARPDCAARAATPLRTVAGRAARAAPRRRVHGPCDHGARSRPSSSRVARRHCRPARRPRPRRDRPRPRADRARARHDRLARAAGSPGRGLVMPTGEARRFARAGSASSVGTHAAAARALAGWSGTGLAELDAYRALVRLPPHGIRPRGRCSAFRTTAPQPRRGDRRAAPRRHVRLRRLGSPHMFPARAGRGRRRDTAASGSTRSIRSLTRLLRRARSGAIGTATRRCRPSSCAASTRAWSPNAWIRNAGKRLRAGVPRSRSCRRWQRAGREKFRSGLRDRRRALGRSARSLAKSVVSSAFFLVSRIADGGAARSDGPKGHDRDVRDERRSRLGGFGPNRDVYAGSEAGGGIWRISNDGASQAQFVGAGISGGVRSVAFDPYGLYSNQIIVATNSRQRLHREQRRCCNPSCQRR